MAKKVFNMEGGLHSANAFTAFEARAYGSCVASPTSLKVVPASGMTVSVSVGDGIIDGQTPRRVQIDAVENITLTPASTSYARKDLIVAYIDSSVSPTTSVVDNTNNVLKFVAVNGTPSAVPATPSSSEIQAKIGAGNQYMILAEINVDRNAVSILENAISDKRNIITVVPVESLSGKITGSQIESSTIGAGNINFATFQTAQTVVYNSETPSIGVGTVGSKIATVIPNTTYLMICSVQWVSVGGSTIKALQAMLDGAEVARIRVSGSQMGVNIPVIIKPTTENITLSCYVANISGSDSAGIGQIRYLLIPLNS